MHWLRAFRVDEQRVFCPLRMREQIDLLGIFFVILFLQAVIAIPAKSQEGVVQERECQKTVGFFPDSPIIVAIDQTKKKTGLSIKLELLGISDNGALSFFLNDVPATSIEALEETICGALYMVKFVIPFEGPKAYDMTLKKDHQKFTREENLRIVNLPYIEGDLCGNPEGSEIKDGILRIHGVPADLDWKVLVGGMAPAKSSSEGGNYYFDLSDFGQGEHEVEIRASRINLCTHRLRINSLQPRIESLQLTYDLHQELIVVQVEGANLPGSLKASMKYLDGKEEKIALVEGSRQGGEAREFSGKARFSKDFSYFSVFFDEKVIKRISGRWRPDGTSLRHWQYLKSFVDLVLDDLARHRTHQGVIRLAGSDFSFVRVPVKNYSIGLTKEQQNDSFLVERHLANPSSASDGLLEIRLARSFLMGVHEVTNEQFHSYLREVNGESRGAPRQLRDFLVADSLPPQISQLPVANVSYIDARLFIKWLQEKLSEKTDKWTIRLPHEIEWEMAARGGDQINYAFLDQNFVEGLKSLQIEGPRSVGSNQWDINTTGIKDLTGNVREWTQTIYLDNLRSLLQFYIDSGTLEAWDPGDPFPGVFNDILFDDLESQSQLISVRGAANGGKDELLFLLALRRKEEMSTGSKDLGFRIVLVAKEKD